MRGSTAAWESLKTTPERISDDTLYFIYENAQSSTDGKLYLGQKLISGTGGNFSGNININDIGDVYIDNETLADKQILVYNETSQQWENTSLSTIINTAVGVMVGASAVAAGSSGLVPVPQQGDQNKFLRGDGTWAPVIVPTFDTNIFSSSNNVISLNGFQGASVGSIPIKTNNGIEWSSAPTGRLDREIITLGELQARIRGEGEAPVSYDTIYMVPNGSNGDSSNKYDEYMVIGDALEHLGTFGEVNLTNYVTTTVFETRVGSIEDILNDTIDENTGDTIPGLVSRVSAIENTYITRAEIGDLSTLILSEGNTTLVEEVNTLSDKLKWHELT